MKSLVSIPSKSGHSSRRWGELSEEYLGSYVSIPSKSGHSSRLRSGKRTSQVRTRFQSPLSRGTPPDVIEKLAKVPAGTFQSPLSRGTPPDLVSVMQSDIASVLFQSPLSRGTPPDVPDWVAVATLEAVSIPSKSGHSSRLQGCLG